LMNQKSKMVASNAPHVAPTPTDTPMEPVTRKVRTAPKLAPDAVPRTVGVARGFLKIVWLNTPATAKKLPDKNATVTRVSLS